MSYDGQAITYDQEGHPLSYLGSTMTWDVHNRLSSIIGATPNGTAENITYTYLSDGSRRSKTVDGVTTTYHYNNGLLLSQTTGDETIRFYYDSTGKVVSIGYQKGSNAEAGYFFARNAQGDIIAVYRSSDSKLIGTYEYDLWGKPVSTTEASAGIDTDGILSKNPLRYRGYYFDEESGFYYLQSRYYDPGVRRFISADSVIASVGTSVEGHNLFGYCFNNPMNMEDETGCWPEGFDYIKMASPIALYIDGVNYACSEEMMEWHFEERIEKNGVHPSYEEVMARKDVWRLLPASQSVFHDNGIGKPELKFITSDGREAVFDGDTLEPVTDPRYMATYNYVPLYEIPSDPNVGDYAIYGCTWIGHGVADVVPYYITFKSNTREEYAKKIPNFF